MYYPYLRGRQYELIALRELAEKNLISDKIIPVIEPVKPTSTLASALISYTATDRKIAFVMNPDVSDFVKQMGNSSNNNRIVPEIENVIEKNNVIKAYLMNADAVTHLKDKEDDYLSEVMTISTSPDGLNMYERIFTDVSPAISLIPSDAVRFKRSISEPKVLFEDRFKKAQKNSDYAKHEDEFFSDDHVFFLDEGFSGFADYSVIGADFNETGFAPLAVAIHIVYFGKKNDLRVRHFVSDSNNDISDPANKFGEAVEKLYHWAKESNIYKTHGLNELISCYMNGRYPGLGTVKKYSVMHHLELMSRYLEEDF